MEFCAPLVCLISIAPAALLHRALLVFLAEINIKTAFLDLILHNAIHSGIAATGKTP